MLVFPGYVEKSNFGKFMSSALNKVKNQNIKDTNSEEFSGSPKAWFILACGWAFYLYEYILRASTSVITNELMVDFGISASAVGALAAFYYFAYVPLQIPCGVIADKFGPRKVVTTSALLCILGSIIFAKSTTIANAQIGRFMIGAGSACAYICCMKIASVWFRKSSFAFIAGISMMMGTFGGIFGGKPFAHLANTQGWRSAMIIAAIVGCVVMVIAWLVIRDKPEGKKSIPHEGGLLDGLKIIAAKPQNWLIGLYGCMMYLPLSAFAELWGVPYLMQRFSITNETASYGSIMVFIGYAVGCLFSAKLSDRWHSRRKVMALSASGTFIGFSAVLFLPNLSFDAILGALFLSGVVSGLSILYFPAAKENNPTKYSATSVGFTNAFVMVSGLVFQPLLGALIDYSWDGNFDASGTPVYAFKDYQFSLTAVIFALLIGRIIVFFIQETYKKEKLS